MSEDSIKAGLQTVLSLLMVAGIVGAVTMMWSLQEKMSVLDTKFELVKARMESSTSDRFTGKDGARFKEDVDRQFDGVHKRLDKLEHKP